MISRRTFIAVASLALAACASTTLRDTWYDPAYRGGAFRKLLVLGVSDNISERRTFEDVMAARLVATGIEAIPGYRIFPERRQSERTANSTQPCAPRWRTVC